MAAAAGKLAKVAFLLALNYSLFALIIAFTFTQTEPEKDLEAAGKVGAASSLLKPVIRGGRPAAAAATPNATRAPVVASLPAPAVRKRSSRGGGRGRFPHFGTDGFARVCNWTAAPPKIQSKECFLLVRPNPKSNEGLAWWATVVAIAHTHSLQTGCRIAVDYGPGVDVGRVLEPPPALEGFPYINWTVPRELEECQRSKRCIWVSDSWKEGHLRSIRSSLRIDAPLVRVIKYRAALGFGKHTFSSSVVRDLMKRFPGYKLRTGMACAFNRVMQLAPTASEYVPNLFTTILPTLRDEEAFVMSLYIRTGWTDKMADHEEKGKIISKDSTSIGASTVSGNVIRCALKLEQEHLARGLYSRTVWMVVTDSPNVGRLAVKSYNGLNITEANQTVLPKPIPRTVLTTQTRGVQTRPRRRPSTQDFAEAMIDWYLIGESDLVISAGSLSFGATGSLRTARPLHETNKECSEKVWPLDKPLDGRETDR